MYTLPQMVVFWVNSKSKPCNPCPFYEDAICPCALFRDTYNPVRFNAEKEAKKGRYRINIFI